MTRQSALSIYNELCEKGFWFSSNGGDNIETDNFIHLLSPFLTPISSIHQLKPLSTEQSTPNTYSGNYGLNTFPFHTDLAHHRIPPRFFLLRCLVGFEDVNTYLIDGREIIRHCAFNLTRAVVMPRRPHNGTVPLLRLLDVSKGNAGLLRWDDRFIKPASVAGEIGFRAFREAIANCSTAAFFLADKGDTLIVDNWRMLHSRSSIPSHSRGRIIERLYLGANLETDTYSRPHT